MKAPCAIIWFRNNLRLHDNPTLVNAIQGSESLLCVYCHEPNEKLELWGWGFHRVGLHRQTFLNQALASLRKALGAKGQVLIECRGKPEVELSRLAKILDTHLIFTEDVQAPHEIEAVNKLRAAQIQVITTWQSSLIDPEDLPFEIGRLPDVFTDFRREIECAGVKPLAPLLPPKEMPALPVNFTEKLTIPEAVVPSQTTIHPSHIRS